MKYSTAKELLSALAWMELPIGKFDAHIKEIDNETEHKEMIRILGELIHGHFLAVTAIVQLHPELDPDKEGETWYNSVKRRYTLPNENNT